MTYLYLPYPVLSPPRLHTAILFTPSGNLVAHASDTGVRSKDQLRVLVGLASEVWLEVGDEGMGMVESEVQRPLCPLLFVIIAAGTTARTNFSSTFASKSTFGTITIGSFYFPLAFYCFHTIHY